MVLWSTDFRVVATSRVGLRPRPTWVTGAAIPPVISPSPTPQQPETERPSEAATRTRAKGCAKGKENDMRKCAAGFGGFR